MAEPEIPIDVDPQTGVWLTDGQPMIYMPRHFFLNYHRAMEQALGPEAYHRQLEELGRLSAYQWCEKEAKTHGLAGLEVFHHYLKQLSRRGWGRFTPLEIDLESGKARVQVEDSLFVPGKEGNSMAGACQMFAGWFIGSLEWAGENMGIQLKLSCREIQCACDGSHDCCIFEVRV